jgi:hypothetical protein
MADIGIEIIKYISLFLIVLAVVMWSLLLARVKAFRHRKMLLTLVVILTAIAVALPSTLSYLEGDRFSFLPYYLICVVYYLTLGAGYIPFLKRIFITRQPSVGPMLIYYLIIMFLGATGFMFGYYYLSNNVLANGGPNWALLSTMVLFIVPFLFHRSFGSYLEIPSKEFKKWYYPFGRQINDPTDKELESPFVISFEFLKRLSDVEMTNFRAKAPAYMALGKLFYYFINDYNLKNPESKIEYAYDKKEPYGWIFHTRPGWIRRRHYLDPEKLVKENAIVENSVITCERIID